MSGGGSGKGGTQTSQVKIDPRLAEGAAASIAGALQSAGLDYAPNRGTTIAGFTPQQMAAFEGANSAASAFGLPTGGVNMPEATVDPSTGIAGYSTGAAYDAMRDASITPEQQAERASILAHYSQSGKNIAGRDRSGRRRSGGSSGPGGADSGSGGTFGMALSNTLGLNRAGQERKDYFPGMTGGGK